MLIKTLGIGAAYCRDNYQYTCNLLDDAVLLDCPPQVVLALRSAAIDISQLRGLVISHFHPDHTLGFPLLISGLPEGEKKFPVIGPAGSRQYFSSLCKLVGKEHKLNRVEFVELSENKTAELPGSCYRVTSFAMKHSPESLGYLIENNNHQTLGFTGDTAWCQGLEQLVQNSDILICEMTFLGMGTEKHLGMETDLPLILELLKPEQRIILTHLEDSRERYLDCLSGFTFENSSVAIAREGCCYKF